MQVEPPERAAIWRLMFITMINLLNQVEGELKAAADLTLMDIGCLFATAAAGKAGVSMGRLAGLFAVEPSVITYRLKRLEELGYARREANPANRRVIHAFITPNGRKELARARTAMLRSVDDHFFAHVRPETMPGLATVLTDLLAAQQSPSTAPLRVPAFSPAPIATSAPAGSEMDPTAAERGPER